VTGVRVKIEPAIIDWVFENIQSDTLPQDISHALEKWRDGTVQPTFKQIQDISNKIHIPLGYFFLHSPPKEEIPLLEYRTIDSVATKSPSRNLVDTIHYAENVQDWMRNHLIDTGGSPLDFVGAGKNIRYEGELAKRIQKDIDLKVDWYTDCKSVKDSFTFIRNKLGSVGILVLMNGVVGNNTHRKLDIDEFRAFTLIDDYAPLIFINRNDSDGARLFSLLHEAVHIWVGVASLYNERHENADDLGDIEKLCNAVAAEILVPNQAFNEKWAEYSKKLPDKDVVNALATLFKCGGTVIARRAKDNAYISSVQYKEIADEAFLNYNQQRHNREGGGDFYLTSASRIDARFLLALDNSIKEEKTQYTEAYRLTNLNRTTFSHLVEQVKGSTQ